MSELNPFSRVCHEVDAPVSASEKEMCPSKPMTTFMLGHEGVPRPVGYGENSWLSTLIVAMLVLLALNFNHCRRLWKNFSQDLLGMRRRANAFDDHTANEARTGILIILLLCLSEGILLLGAAGHFGMLGTETPVFATTMMLSGCALAFYLLQLAAYHIIGYAFSDKFGTSQWVRGFTSSQALLSFMLLIPALVSLFYPSSSGAMLVIAIIAYILARLFFISKGFRIFYDKIPSLLYFILYLCALEIIPLLVIRAGSSDLLRLF